uniref:Uncharacterized protein n=1 Tax=Glossina austeni TaxID=7395 RepID=A0A1A9UDY7_GLOAU
MTFTRATSAHLSSKVESMVYRTRNQVWVPPCTCESVNLYITTVANHLHLISVFKVKEEEKEIIYNLKHRLILIRVTFSLGVIFLTSVRQNRPPSTRDYVPSTSLSSVKCVKLEHQPNWLTSSAQIRGKFHNSNICSFIL